MKTLYGNEIKYIRQYKCKWGGNGYIEAHYDYDLIDKNLIFSGIKVMLTAEQATRFADINGYTILK